MKAVLTCCICYSKATVKADLVVNGDDLETWWLLRRRQCCATCWVHTCWHPMEGDTYCFLDIGHPGDHRPWKDEYGDTADDVEPIVNLWANWDRPVHASAP